MSHMAIKKSEPGKPVLVDLEAVRLAATNCGLACEARSDYRWYGQSVGDYAVPAGFTAAELGKNAVLVLAVPEPKRSELRHRYGQDPYELGIVPDPLNPGCYTMMCDYFMRGYGLCDLVGDPIYADGQLEQLAPLFLMHYRMCADAVSARQAGDTIQFERQPDGSFVSYTVADEGRLLATL